MPSKKTENGLLDFLSLVSDEGFVVRGELLAYGRPTRLNAKPALKPVLKKLYRGFFFLWQVFL